MGERTTKTNTKRANRVIPLIWLVPPFPLSRERDRSRRPSVDVPVKVSDGQEVAAEVSEAAIPPVHPLMTWQPLFRNALALGLAPTGRRRA